MNINDFRLEEKPLGKLCKMTNGSTSEQSKSLTQFPVTRIETISDGFINKKKVNYVEFNEREAENYKLDKGDILFSHINSFERVGHCAIVEESDLPIYHGMNLLRIKANSEEIIPEYLFIYFKTGKAKAFYEEFAQRAINQASINQNTLKNLVVVYPKDKTEQSQIAKTIRDKLNLLIEMRQAALKQKEAVEALQGALLREVFPYKEGDELPEGWKWIKIKDVTHFKNGLNYSESDVMQGIKIVGVSCFKKHFYVKEELLDEVSFDIVRDNDFLQDGDLIVVRSNGNPELVGRHIIFRGSNKITNSGFTIRMRLNTDILYPEFYLLYAKSAPFREQIKGQGSNISNLSQDRLKKVILPAPKSTIEQKELTDKFLIKLEKLEELKYQILTQLEAIEALPAAILREIFEFNKN